MKGRLNLWLSQSSRFPGVLGCGLHYPDRTHFTQGWADGFDPGPLEKALACAADVWRLLRVSGISGQWLRWSYRDAWVYFTQRSDGIALGVIASRNTPAVDPAQVADLLESFLSVPGRMGQNGEAIVELKEMKEGRS